MIHQKSEENLLEHYCLWKSNFENVKSKRKVVYAVFTYDESQTLQHDLLMLILLYRLDEFIAHILLSQPYIALYTVQAVER